VNPERLSAPVFAGAASCEVHPSPSANIRSCRSESCALEVTSRRPWVSSLARVSSKSERRAAREVVAAYHETRLAELCQRVGEAVDRFRAGELHAFDADRIIFEHSPAAKELWKFCNLPDFDVTARVIGERVPADWWELGTPTHR